MLPDPVKKTIQSNYQALARNLSLKARYGQRQMIADIANTLSALAVDDEIDKPADTNDADNSPPTPVCVVEAGTGTGKTLAYILGVLPLARHLGKKVVISTATVALQEQLLNKDLPAVLMHSDLQFSYTLAKGRGRYVCLSRLDMLLQDNASQLAMQELFGDWLTPAQDDQRALYQQMLERISAGDWGGDRDSWEGTLSEAQWRPVTVDTGQCAGQKCSNFSRCCFYQAREAVQDADCVVANHDLVLVDLALGGGAVLPDPADTIYVFDEAHHLPDKANQHFACTTRLGATRQWLEHSGRLLSRLVADTSGGAGASAMASLHATAAELMPLLSQGLVDAERACQQLADALSAEGDDAAWVFELGVVDAGLREMAQGLATQFENLYDCLSDMAGILRKNMEQGDGLAERQQAELWFPQVGGMVARCEASQQLWYHFGEEDPQGRPPWARWLSVVEQGEQLDLQLACSPVLAADTLRQALWSRCAAAVLTSATLSALGRFDVFQMRAGLPVEAQFFRIPSPFDHAAAARFVVPRMGCEPGDVAAHTAAIAALLPDLLAPEEAALMLFSSRRQMLAVLEDMPGSWRERILCQDDYQKAQLLRYHRQRVDEGKGSVIFGLASFAEGVDLPGKYCEHVLIAKLPFPVPNDPIEATLAQWLESRGRNPFLTLSVPEAALRLVQASGRLLRSESDRGQITLFDERIVTRRYGKAILDSLPPFTRHIFPDEPGRLSRDAAAR